jgi:hypothetical protein
MHYYRALIISPNGLSRLLADAGPRPVQEGLLDSRPSVAQTWTPRLSVADRLAGTRRPLVETSDELLGSLGGQSQMDEIVGLRSVRRRRFLLSHP